MATFVKVTDEKHEVQLPSTIVRAFWSKTEAKLGDKARLHIQTQFVKDGAKVSFKIYAQKDDKQTKVLRPKPGKTNPPEGKITKNECYLDFKIDFEEKEMESNPWKLVFVAEIPSYNLKATSNVLQVGRIEVQVQSVDAKFAPKLEEVEIKYKITDPLKMAQSGKLRVYGHKYQGADYSDKKSLVYERPLTLMEIRQSDKNPLKWLGDCTCTAGPLKKEGAKLKFINPLFSPYTIELIVSDTKDVDKDAKAIKSKPVKKIGTDQTTVLYDSLKLSLGTWTPDEMEPDKSQEKKWVQYKLNELGYHVGPVDGSTGANTKKAIKRYKHAHKTLRTDTTNNITEDLKKELEAGTNKREILEGGKLPDKEKIGKVWVHHNFFYEKPSDWGAATNHKNTCESKVLSRPTIPIEAKILIKSKAGTPVEVPEAVGDVRVDWIVKDPEEDVTKLPTNTNANAPSRTRQYVNLARKVHGGGPNGDNCPKALNVLSGVREHPKNYHTAVWLGTKLEPYNAKQDDAKKVVYTKAWANPNKHKKKLGRAGIIFRPSYIGGDDYQITARLSFSDQPDEAKLRELHGLTAPDQHILLELGTLVIWRVSNLAAQVNWPAPPTAIDWAGVRQQFRHTYIEIPDAAPPATEVITNVLTDAQYRAILQGRYNSGAQNVAAATVLPDSLYPWTPPAQRALNAPQYVNLLRNEVYTNLFGQITWRPGGANTAPLQDAIANALRPTHPEGYIVVCFAPHRPMILRQAPPANMTVVSNNFVVGFTALGGPGGVLLMDQMGISGFIPVATFQPAPVNLYKSYHYYAHEMGHCHYLMHHENTGSNTPAEHDTNDHNCIMSYCQPTPLPALSYQAYGIFAPTFCGKCNLRLRGWDVRSPGVPASS